MRSRLSLDTPAVCGLQITLSSCSKRQRALRGCCHLQLSSWLQRDIKRSIDRAITQGSSYYTITNRGSEIKEEAVALIVNGFAREVLQALPMEFAMEAQQLVAISLEGSVG